MTSVHRLQCAVVGIFVASQRRRHKAHRRRRLAPSGRQHVEPWHDAQCVWRRAAAPDERRVQRRVALSVGN